MTPLHGARGSKTPRDSGQRKTLGERAVARLWRDASPRLPPLECADGTRVRVIYPGRPSSAAGPDFRDAVLETGRGDLLRGDVEIHLRPRDWRAHGHGSDRRYNGVVLHVVLWPRAGGPSNPIVLASGARVPTAALAPSLNAHESTPRHSPDRLDAATGLPSGQQERHAALAPSLSARSPAARLPIALPEPPAAEPHPNAARGHPSEDEERHAAPAPMLPIVAAAAGTDLQKAVARAGDARFLARSRAFRRALRAFPLREAVEEALYRGLMEALGYSRNREPFAALAQGLPLRALRRHLLGVGEADRVPTLRALLLGAAGLLDPSDGTPRGPLGGNGHGPSPADRWRASGLSPVLGLDAWRLFRIRPGNHPRRRLLGAAVLLDRAWERGLLADLADRVLTGGVTEVRAGLVARDPGSGDTLIGPGRAGDIAVNVLLPFVHAWGRLDHRPQASQAALRLYRAWPPLQENEITREMAERLADLPWRPGAAAGARAQQGLMEMYARLFGRG